MGRELELKNLSDKEQAQILKVIQRDFALRRKESQRLDGLQKIVVKKEQRDDATKCIVCGSTFIWIFNPKMECFICRGFFCKSKAKCGYKEEERNEMWLCVPCGTKKKVQLMTLDWYYGNIKTKFRRHGGAKVLREFYKKKKGQKTDVKKLGITSNDRDKEIERVIATILLPKIEEIKPVQDTSCSNESAKAVEKMLENFLKEVTELQRQNSLYHTDDDLLCRYLKDHKQYLMMRLLKELTQLKKATSSGSNDNSLSPVRNAETMTEFSDSEYDSLPSCSGSMRSLSSFNTLPDKFHSFNHFSLTNSSRSHQQFEESRPRIIQGILNKEDTVVSSQVNAALSEVFDESYGNEKANSFSTELKFTAVDASTDKIGMSRRSSDSSKSQDQHEESNNWIITLPKPKSTTFFQKRNYFPSGDAPSAYEHYATNLDDDVIRYHATEEEVLPIAVKKELTDVSARSLGRSQKEVVIPENRKFPTMKLDNLDDIAELLFEDIQCPKQYQLEQFQTVHDVTLHVCEEVVATERKPNHQENDSLAKEAEKVLLQQRKSCTKDSLADSDYQSASSVSDFTSNSISIENSDINSTNLAKRSTGSRSLLASSHTIFARRTNAIRLSKNVPVSEDNDPSEKYLPKRQLQVDLIVEHEHLDKAFEEAYGRRKMEKCSTSSTSSTSETDDSDTNPSSVQKNTSIVDLKKIASNFAEPAMKPSESDCIETAAACAVSSESVDVIDKSVSKTMHKNYSNDLHCKTENELHCHHTTGQSLLRSSSFSNSSSTSSSSSSYHYDSASKIESDQNQTNATCETPSLFENELDQKSVGNEGNIDIMSGKSIDEIVKDLRTAGLTARKTKFNRSSLNSKPVKSQAFSHSQISKKTSDSNSVNKVGDDIDWDLYGFKVDPANFKKKEKIARGTSLISLVYSDNESKVSGTNGTLSSRASDQKSSFDTTELLPSVAKRRFLFDKFQNQPFVSDWRSAKSVEDNATLQFALPNMKIIEKALNPDVKSEICHTSSNPGLASSENINSENNFQIPYSTKIKDIKLKFECGSNAFTEEECEFSRPRSSSSTNENQNFVKGKTTLEQLLPDTNIEIKENLFSESATGTEEIKLDHSEKENLINDVEIKSLPPTEQSNLAQIMFNRSSPIRGSLTMRGSRAAQGSNNKQLKKKLSSNVSEE